MNYTQNNHEHLEAIRLKFGQRLQDSLDCFQKNLEMVKEKLEEKKSDDEQKTIDKFEKWYFFLKKRKEELKKEMEKREEKKNRNCENFLELDNENQKKRIELKKKLDGFEKRKREISEKNRIKISEIMEKERQSLIRIQEKKKKSDDEKNIYYDNILKYQTSVIKRGDLKESSSELSRTSA